MCLPYIDCRAIDEHCQKQETREHIAITTLGALFLFATIVAVVSSYITNRRRKRAQKLMAETPAVTITKYDGAGSLDGGYDLATLHSRQTGKTMVLQAARQAAREIEANEERRALNRARRMNTI